MASEMDLKQWHEQQFLPWKQAVARIMDDRAAQQKLLQQHVGQLQVVLALLMDGKVRAAVNAWNTLQLSPVLENMLLSADGESVELVEVGGRKMVLRLDDVLEDLQRLLDERAAK
ncbi:MAG: hypothetical protein H6922_06125 [Pseudomonadaceae bacterium]|nr:hypothetical protein [Pseudomonadaceae bacterium]